ncbi:MAG: hypothetical protein AAB787_00615 [Patescibacteria group bacterium]
MARSVLGPGVNDSVVQDDWKPKSIGGKHLVERELVIVKPGVFDHLFGISGLSFPFVKVKNVRLAGDFVTGLIGVNEVKNSGFDKWWGLQIRLDSCLNSSAPFIVGVWPDSTLPP